MPRFGTGLNQRRKLYRVAPASSRCTCNHQTVVETTANPGHELTKKALPQ